MRQQRQLLGDAIASKKSNLRVNMWMSLVCQSVDTVEGRLTNQLNWATNLLMVNQKRDINNCFLYFKILNNAASPPCLQFVYILIVYSLKHFKNIEQRSQPTFFFKISFQGLYCPLHRPCLPVSCEQYSSNQNAKTSHNIQRNYRKVMEDLEIF